MAANVVHVDFVQLKLETGTKRMVEIVKVLAVPPLTRNLHGALRIGIADFKRVAHRLVHHCLHG
jgi:hypothetical protein